MTRERFIAVIYFVMVVAPLSFLRYQWDYLYVNTFGKGKNVYKERVPNSDAHTRSLRLGTVLGLVYILGFNALLFLLTATGRASWMVPAGLIGVALMGFVTYQLPDWAIFQSPFRQAYSSRFAGVLRLSFYTALLIGLAHLRVATGGRSAAYVILLWLVPISTSFMFYMFLRDVYQHSNADNGRLTNSRVFFSDPFTRWAVFVYGQDMHIPHHLFPAIPHYKLRQLHSLLKGSHDEYRTTVVECHGTFHDDRGRPTILDVLTHPTAEVAGSSVSEPCQVQVPG
jgi:hypothetical protein